ncbi:hypothetical protein DFH28DRAFT_923314 [Melampsora americana]|nr:hypothetical protein DFH28DRAFT_923314 [Melampsora americana]
MQEVLNIEEGKKKALALKQKEQAEERERRAGMREGGLTEVPKGPSTGEQIKTLDTTLTLSIQPTEVQGDSQPNVTGNSPILAGGENQVKDDPLIVDLCKDEDVRSESSGVKESDKKRSVGKSNLVKKRKTKTRKGKGRKSKSSSPIGGEEERDEKALYGGLIEADSLISVEARRLLVLSG